MPITSALLKAQIESQLAHRIPAALSPAIRPEIERYALADEQLNQLLGGGVPVGAITEVHGSAGSGRTSLALSLAAAVTAAGRVAAWVDVADALDPEGAALCGVDLEQLLWVRCGSGEGESSKQRGSAQQNPAVPDADTYSTKSDDNLTNGCARNACVNTTGPNLVAQQHVPKPVGSGGCGSPHPRGEGRGMPEAIESLLQQQPRSAAGANRRSQRKIGTPGMPNRDLRAIGAVQEKATASGQASAAVRQTGAGTNIVPTRKSLYGRQVGRDPLPFPHASPYREEQVATDRQPSRRAVLPAAQQRTVAACTKAHMSAPASVRQESAKADPWKPLDQALRVVDLLLQAGGFSLLVLDLGDVPANVAWRIPLATWFRFRAGCERSRASLLVIAQHPCARASADLTVAMRPGALHSCGDTVMTGSEYLLRTEQQRRGTNRPESNVVTFRKPVRADHTTAAEQGWTAAGTWSLRA